MSTSDTVARGEPSPDGRGPVKVTVYHNNEAPFLPYRDGQLLTAVTCVLGN
jgi:hypothetical protein